MNELSQMNFHLYGPNGSSSPAHLSYADCKKGELAKGSCLHELFQEQAEHTPAAFAVIDRDRCLSYRELNRRSNQLAHNLRELGVRPETLVAIHMQRSMEMIVGILGILKAGGAYVPMDPEYPAARLAFMLEETRAQVLLTTRTLSDRSPATSASVVYLDDWKNIDREVLEQQTRDALWKDKTLQVPPDAPTRVF